MQIDYITVIACHIQFKMLVDVSITYYIHTYVARRSKRFTFKWSKILNFSLASNRNIWGIGLRKYCVQTSTVIYITIAFEPIFLIIWVNKYMYICCSSICTMRTLSWHTWNFPHFLGCSDFCHYPTFETLLQHVMFDTFHIDHTRFTQCCTYLTFSSYRCNFVICCIFFDIIVIFVRLRIIQHFLTAFLTTVVTFSISEMFPIFEVFLIF